VGRHGGNDVPGNAMESQRQYVQALVRQAEVLLRIEKHADHLFEEGFELVRITLRFPTTERGSYMAVVAANDSGKAVVAFHDAPTLMECLVGVAERLENRSLKFKEDKYAN